jgi:hypothetical protein
LLSKFPNPDSDSDGTDGMEKPIFAGNELSFVILGGSPNVFVPLV